MSYYFIGNGSATIGGGSMGRTEQVPSLKLLCLDLCSRHLDQMNNLGDMPTEMFIDLLNRAKTKATPEVVQRLQDINERLLCEDVDVAFWKRAVDEHILRRMIPAPGPVLVERVNDFKERLVELIAVIPETPSKKWSLEVNEILKDLGEIPASVGLLRETMIGKAVGPLRKTSDAHIASLSADIIRRWKEAARTNGPEQQKCSPASSSTPSKAGGSVGVSEDKQRAVEEGFNCRTWNSLYKYLELLREDKVRVSSKRAREARERELQKKPRMIVGKSKGEGFVVQRSGRGSGKAPPIEIPISHASSIMKTTTSKGGRSNSGIKTSGIKTSGTKTSGIKSSGIMASGKNKRSISGISSKTKSGSNSSSSRSSSSSSTSTSTSTSSSSSSKRKNGVATLADIRRKIAIDQRHSTAFKGDRPGPSNEELPPGKRSKFWQ